MWFVGLMIGLVLGSLLASGLGALVGGILGLVGGLIYSEQSQKRPKPLEQRVAALEKSVRQLSLQIAALQPASPQAHQAVPDSQLESASVQPDPIAPAASLSVEAGSVLPAIPVVADFPLGTPALNRPESRVNSETPHDFKPASEEWINTPLQNEWLARLLKGNILAKIGVVILFFGIASGLKLAVDIGLFPISVRLLLGALAAISMSFFGYHRAQQPEHRMFGQALQGGGLGILYLLVYFMLARYQLMGEMPGFVLFTLIGVTCVLLAARQDARSLAMLGISGAFLSPVMAAGSGGSQITLFSYFLLLNAFIISVNWFKGWRELNMSGFIFTLVIGMNWAFRFYQPSDFPVSETFLILFFLLYSVTPVLFNLLNAPGRLSWGDGMLLYGTPIAAAALQNHLLKGQDMTLAWNACVAGTYYLMLWWAIYRRPNEETVWLEKSLLGIALGFFTLAIPLAFDAQLTSAFWTLEGFGVLYLGVRQNRWLASLSGSALQVLAGLYFFAHSHELRRVLPVFNDWYVGCLIVVIAALSSALLLRTTEYKTSRFAQPFLYWGLLWWFAAGFSEIDRFAPDFYKMAAFLGLCVVSLIFLEWFGAKRNWHAMRQPSAWLLLAILVAAFDGYLKEGHALYGIMSLLIPLALLAHYWLLYRHDRDSVPSVCQIRHAVGYWLSIILVGSELAWIAEQFSPGNSLWYWLAWGASGSMGILASHRGLQLQQWPFAQYRALYGETLPVPVALLLGAWLIFGNLTHSGGGSGLPYLPVLNPFDLIQLLAMFSLWKWLRAIKSPLSPAIFALAFLWISTEAARLTHHWGGVPFEKQALLGSFKLQAGLSLLWTAIAMGVMVYASQCKQRALWFIGFALLAIVGIKLMLVDLSNKGTVLWTLSLIGIALLIIVASYFSPAPPKVEK